MCLEYGNDSRHGFTSVKCITTFYRLSSDVGTLYLRLLGPGDEAMTKFSKCIWFSLCGLDMVSDGMVNM